MNFISDAYKKFNKLNICRDLLDLQPKRISFRVFQSRSRMLINGCQYGDIFVSLSVDEYEVCCENDTVEVLRWIDIVLFDEFEIIKDNLDCIVENKVSISEDGINFIRHEVSRYV